MINLKRDCLTSYSNGFRKQRETMNSPLTVKNRIWSKVKRKSIFLLAGSGAIVNIIVGFGTFMLGLFFGGPLDGTQGIIGLIRMAVMLINSLSWLPFGLLFEFLLLPENGLTILVVFALDGAFWFLIGGQIVVSLKSRKDRNC